MEQGSGLDLTAVFHALSDPTRQRVIEVLSAGPRRAGELAEALGASAPSMSRHLRVLLGAGLVVDERRAEDARIRMFQLRPESDVGLQAWLDQIKAHWDTAAELLQTTRRDERQDMSEARSVSVEVEVGVDPRTAFIAFTDELDFWLVRGPINIHDARRASRFLFEGGIGGRLVEVYDNGDEPRELARITSWNPGASLGWQSSTDDVATQVTFEASTGGTFVRVVARLPAGGEDRGGTSWTRVVVPWFGSWCARRDHVSHQRRDINRLALATYYSRPGRGGPMAGHRVRFRICRLASRGY